MTKAEELEEQNILILKLNYEREEAVKKVNILEQILKEQKDEIKTTHDQIQQLEELAAQNEFASHFLKSKGSSLADELGLVSSEISEK